MAQAKNLIHKWHEVVNSDDLDLLGNLIAEGAVFSSPVVFTPMEGKEITMMVGSDCVNSFKGAHFSEKLEKVYREEQTRKMFDEWFPKAWVEFTTNNKSRWSMPYKTYKYYKELRNIQRHYEGWTGYDSTNPSELTTRKLLGIMKRGAQYVALPELYQWVQTSI